MSCDKKFQPLTQDQIQKTIVAKPQVLHDVYDFLNYSEKYRDEEYELYCKKKNQFLDCAKEYLLENRKVLNSSRARVPDPLDDFMQKSFEIEIPDEEEKDLSNGALIRKRSLRKIHEVITHDIEQCCTDPWFRRLIILNKFIHVARKIILQNRLLKRLAILKSITEEDIEDLEQSGRKYANISYEKFFEPFVL